MVSLTAAGSKLTQLVEDLLAGKRAALAKAITAVESGSALGGTILGRIRATASERLGREVVVGITGSPGCGKSTLTSALLGRLRARHLQLGVIAVDPSSPLSGGALLGDRLRMAEHASDPGVFVRSLSSRGKLGGLAPSAREIVTLMAAAGKDLVVVETVGAGQSEVEIARIADVKVVVTAPGLGDDIQALKSGILEIADVLVVNKGDLPGAEQAASQLRAMQALRPASLREVPVLVTSATEGHGLDELSDTILALGAKRPRADQKAGGLAAVRAALIAEVTSRLRASLEAEGERLDQAYGEAILKGELTLDSAARQIVEQARILPGPPETG